MSTTQNATHAWAGYKAFVDVKLAIGYLVLSGVHVIADPTRGGALQLVCGTTGDVITYCYRDGTSWKVKADTVQDWIDNA